MGLISPYLAGGRQGWTWASFQPVRGSHRLPEQQFSGEAPAALFPLLFPDRGEGFLGSPLPRVPPALNPHFLGAGAAEPERRGPGARPGRVQLAAPAQTPAGHRGLPRRRGGPEVSRRPGPRELRAEPETSPPGHTGEGAGAVGGAR